MDAFLLKCQYVLKYYDNKAYIKTCVFLDKEVTGSVHLTHPNLPVLQSIRINFQKPLLYLFVL